MTVQIKYLVFKGITKKEEILFKSFLNLAKNELPYQVVVLKSGKPDANSPDIVIIDENYELDESELGIVGLPTIIVGVDHRNEEADYITRPVQWSEFKQAFTGLIVTLTEESGSSERLLPSEARFAIAEIVESTPADFEQYDALESSDQQYSNEGEYEYELGNMSIDLHGFTNSDYEKVADDVKHFQTGTDQPESREPVILMTDEESASANSVLVIETDAMDAWDFEDSQLSIGRGGVNSDEQSEDSENAGMRAPRLAGFEVEIDEQYWLEDNEIIIDNKSFLFVKPERKMVYSDTEPGKWPSILQRRALLKMSLPDDWRPEAGIKVYPLSSLIWVNTLINETDELLSGLDEDDEYILEKWPNFDLLELDNVLLKLCTMLFVRPETVASLGTKSGFGRSTIVGLMNACYEMGCLTTPDKIDVNKLAHTAGDEGMLDKIKDVFR